LSFEKYAFYVQEMAADDPRRVMSQKILLFEMKDKDIVESVWSLVEPLRWRDGHLNPDMFRAIVPRDLRQLPGCELKWKKVDKHFVASNDPKTCRAPSHGGGAPMQLDERIELGAEELAIADRLYDATGHLVQGRDDEPFNRYRKQSQ
jgi:hypothetical protein